MPFTLESQLRPRVGLIYFDLNLTETHGIEVDLTPHPIAADSSETEHAVTRPRVFSCTGLISSESAGILDVWRNVRDRIANGEARHVTAWKEIVNMANSHEAVLVRTTLETLYNMQVRRAETVREGLDGIFVNLTLQQFTRAELTEEYNVGAEFVDSAEAAGNLGTQGTTAVEGFGSLGGL